jgi:hypothetical protein
MYVGNQPRLAETVMHPCIESTPPRETYTQRNACTLFEIYIYVYIRIDVLTLQIDTLVDVGRRFVCWFSVNRQPGRDWQLCIQKLEGKEEENRKLLLFIFPCFEYQ